MIVAFVTMKHPAHISWFKSINAVLLPVFPSSKLQQYITVSTGTRAELVASGSAEFLRRFMLLVESLVLKRKNISLALGEGGWTLTHLALLKKFSSNTSTILVSGDPLFYTLVFEKRKLSKEYLSMLKYVDYVIATSEYVRTLASNFISKDRIFVVYPHYVHACPNSKFIRTKIKYVLSHIRNKPVLAYVGALTHIKGFDLLLKSFEILLKYNKNVRLLIAGKGEFITLLSDYLKKYKDKILYFGYTNPEPIYRYAHMYLHPARFDAFPVSVLEAILCGCIPVVSNCTGSVEVIPVSLRGLLVVNKLEPEVIASKVLDLLYGDTDSLKCVLHHLERLQSIVRHNFSKEKSVSNFLSVISRIMEKG